MYTLSWHIPKRVILNRIVGNFGLEQMLECNAAITAMVEEGEGPVHLIVVIENVKSFPTQVNEIKRSTEAMMKHPDFGWIFFIGFDNPLTRFLSSLVSQVAHIQFQHLSSINDIDNALARVDQSLGTAPSQTS